MVQPIQEIRQRKQRRQRPPVGRGFLRFCLQCLSAMAIFFCVIQVMQGAEAEQQSWRTFLRNSFTQDADLAAVMERLQVTLPGEAVAVTAQLPEAQQAMAPVSGRVVEGSYSQAVRIATEPGEPVVAVYNGTVTQVEQQEDGLYTLEVSHTNGVVTVYRDCGSCQVAVHQPVRQGEVLGTVSQWTASQGQDGQEPGFWFGARYLGEDINPLSLFRPQEV